MTLTVSKEHVIVHSNLQRNYENNLIIWSHVLGNFNCIHFPSCACTLYKVN